jgi:hypothetical protein
MKKIIHVLAALFCFLAVNPAFALLTTPSLVIPLNGSTNISVVSLLDWSFINGATEYQYKLGTNATLLGVNSQTVIGASQVNTANLFFGTVYYWQVRAIKSSSPYRLLRLVDNMEFYHCRQHLIINTIKWGKQLGPQRYVKLVRNIRNHRLRLSMGYNGKF